MEQCQHQAHGIKWNITVPLISLVILSFLLRFIGLDHESMWNDELSSMHRSSYETLSEVISKGVVPDVHPPGYQIMLFFVIKAFGATETSLRFPSVLAGVLTVLLVFSIGRKLFDTRTAILSSSMLAVSPMHIWLSQEARPYSLLIMLTTILVYLLVLYTTSHSIVQRKLIVAFMSLNIILLSYLHYFGLLVSALVGIGLFVDSIMRKQNRIVIALSLIIPVVAYLPWIPVMIRQSLNGTYISRPDLMALVYLFIEYMGWSKPLLEPIRKLITA